MENKKSVNEKNIRLYLIIIIAVPSLLGYSVISSLSLAYLCYYVLGHKNDNKR